MDIRDQTRRAFGSSGRFRETSCLMRGKAGKRKGKNSCSGLPLAGPASASSAQFSAPLMVTFLNDPTEPVSVTSLNDLTGPGWQSRMSLAAPKEAAPSARTPDGAGALPLDPKPHRAGHRWAFSACRLATAPRTDPTRTQHPTTADTSTERGNTSQGGRGMLAPSAGWRV